MFESNRMHIKITVKNDEERVSIGNKIHEQLVGNPDYIENRIVLNIETKNEINLYIDCDDIPTIVI